VVCDDGLSRRVFGSLMTVRMGASVGRLPPEVLLEEFYRSERSETVRVGCVRVFEDFLTMFDCSVLTFGVQQSSIVNREPRVRYNIKNVASFIRLL
jgi:hypothetical protein